MEPRNSLAQTELLEVSELLGNLGLGLTDSHDTVHGVLQHLQNKPWHYLDTSSDSYSKHEQDWALLLEGIEGMATQKFEFLAHIWEAGSSSNEPQIKQLACIAKYCNTSFTTKFVTFVNGVLQIEQTITASPISCTTVKLDTAISFIKAYQNHSFETVFLFQSGQDNHVQLIAQLDLIYPNKMTLGEYLLDQVNQLGLLSKAVADRVNTKNIEDIVSNTEIFEDIQNLVSKLGMATGFKELWNEILPQNGDHFIIRKLLEIEPLLSTEEKLQLRITLIQQFHVELFYPIRIAIQEKKTREEEIAKELAEIKTRLNEENKILQTSIALETDKLLKIQKNMKKCISKSDQGKEKMIEIQKQELADKKKIADIEARIQDLKEKAAFSKFLQEISNYSPTEYAKICPSLKNINPKTMDFPELVTNIGKIFKIPTNSPHLLARVSKSYPSDRNDFLLFLEGLNQEPLFERDGNHDLSISGRNVILSSVMQKLKSSTQALRPRQIQITAQETLILDASFPKSVFHGINLILLAKHVVGGNTEITINVSGSDGGQHCDPKAKDGVTEGADGEDGQSGNPGENGGNVHIEGLLSCVNLDSVAIDCSGGHGADGQHGGKGHKGRNGEDGKDGFAEIPGDAWSMHDDDYLEGNYYSLARGTKGSPGQPGGAGGLGGFGGPGGQGGRSTNWTKGHLLSEVNHDNGRNGKNGKNGAGGVQGEHGYHGKDHGYAARSHYHPWVEVKGYNIQYKRVNKKFGSVTGEGYRMWEGDAPEKVSNLKTKTKNDARKRTKSIAIQRISSKSIDKAKKLITGECLLTTGKNEESRGDHGELSALEKAQSELMKIKSSSHEGTCVEKDTGNFNLASVESLQRSESDVSNSIRATIKRKEVLVGVLEKVQSQEQEATIRAQQLEQAAVNWKEAQEEALELSRKTQVAMVTEATTEVTRLQENTQNANDFESLPSIESCGMDSISGQLVEYGNESKNKHFSAFKNLVLGQDAQTMDALEACFQELERQNYTLDEEGHILIKNLGMNGNMKLEYIKDGLSKDLILGQKYSSLFPKDSLNGITLTQLFLNVRLGQRSLPDLNNTQNLEVELDSHLKTLEEAATLNDALKDWLQFRENADGKSAKSSSYKQDDLANAKFKETLLREGLELFRGIQRHFPNPSLTLARFLTDLRDYVEKKMNHDDSVDFDGFCRTRKELGYDKLQDILKIQKGTELSENQLTARLSAAQFIISKFLFLTLNQQDEVRYFLQKLEKKAKESRNARNLIHQLDQFILNVYEKTTKEPILESIREKISENSDDQKSKNAMVDKIVVLTESIFRNEKLEKRHKRYAELEKNTSTKNLQNTLRDIYKGTHEEYMDASHKTMDFFRFNDFISTTMKQWDPDETKTQVTFPQIMWQIEAGKMTNKELTDFSREELAQLETTLWESLSTTNSTAVEEIERQIQKCSSIRFDTAAIRSYCDVTTCIKTKEKILNGILPFIPNASADSSITDGKRIQKYIHFTLLRIEMCLYKSSDCGQMMRIAVKLNGLDKSNLDNVIKVLEDFLDKMGSCRLLEFENWSACAEHLKNADFEKLSDFTSLLISLIFLVKWKTSEEDSPLAVDVGEIIGKVNENGHTEEGEAKKCWEELIDFLDYLNSPQGRTVPHNFLNRHMIEFRNDARNNWRKIENLLRKGEDLLQQLSDNSKPLYLTANFSAAVQNKVLAGVTLNNVNERLVQLYEQFPDPSSLKRELGENNTAQVAVRTEQIQLSLTAGGYPFIKELGILVQAHFPVPRARGHKNFEILSQQLKFINYPDLSVQWQHLTQYFTENPSTSKMLSAQLAQIVVSLNYTDPLSALILRIVENLIVNKATFDKPQQRNTQINPDNLTTSDLYDILLPKFEREKIHQLFLQEEEKAHFDALNVVQYPEFSDRFKKMVCTLPPSSWKCGLEREYFNLIFRRLSVQSSAVLDQRNSLFETVRVMTKISPRGRKVLRAIQQTKLYEEFKLTYALQEESARFRWLQFLNKVLTRVVDSGIKLFDTARDIRIFLKTARDIDFNSFEKIINTRFPQNWIKWILIRSIQIDLELVDKAKNSEEKTPKETIHAVVEPLKVLLESKDYQAYRLVTLLHSRVRKEADIPGGIGVTGSDKIIKILVDISQIIFEPNEMKHLNDDLTLDPLQYWPRVIRIFKVQRRLPSEMTDFVLGMDESFSEKLVDLLVDKISTSKWTLSEQKSVISKFFSSEWLLEEELLNDLSPDENYENAVIRIMNYSTNRRKADLSLEQLLKSASNFLLNKNWTLDKISGLNNLVNRIKKTLADDYPAENECKPSILKEKISGFLNSWRQRYGSRSWVKETPFNDEETVQTVALLCRAVNWKFMDEKNDVSQTLISPREAQLVSVLLLIEGIGTGKGRLGEIQTGEGKSCIVAMFAAFCALFNARVHVITSNKILAQADSTEYAKFYAILGLFVGNNCDEKARGDSARKKVYNNNVIYGELTEFQGDYLNTDFHLKKIMTDKADIIVVDEVDSLLLDKGANMLYLSHQIPEMKHLRPIFLLIWDAVQQCKIKWDKISTRPYTEGHVTSVKKAVEFKLLHSDAVKMVPVCLNEFIRSRVGIWVKQAFAARFMPLNESFILDGNNKVVNMDNDTGVEQGNMQLSFGLHQFLQLKYKSKLAPESLKCVFISNVEYFTKEEHKGNLFGITGTLGGLEETQLLRDVYDVEFFSTPKYKLNKRVELDPIIAKDDTDWKEEIKASVATLAVAQPILIITENMAEYSKIHEAVSQVLMEPRLQLWEYKSSESDAKFTEKIKNDGGLKAREVVVSTNLGGRGTDLAVAKGTELHVILTYLPPNVRVEKQAFGRTARAGQNGTVQFIIKNANSATSLHQLKEERRQRDVRRLQIIKTKDIPKIKMEDKLFKKYSKFCNITIRNHETFRLHRKRLRELQLQFLNNRWAIWLDSIRHRLDYLHLPGVAGKDKILHEFDTFKQQQLDKLSSNEIKIFAEFPSEFVKLGVLYERFALKTLLSTGMKGEYKEMELVGKEVLENISKGAASTTKTISKLANDPTKILEVINEKWDKHVHKTSDLDKAFKMLEMVAENDLHYSEAAHLYLGSLTLQKNPKDKQTAKKSLIKAREKILSIQGLHHSYINLLDNALKKAIENGEDNSVSQNNFQQQLHFENNLLDIHLDSIQAAFPTEITPDLLKHRIEAVDTKEEAQSLLDFLLQSEWNLLKGWRFSKSFVQSLSDGDEVKVQKVLKEKFGGMNFPCDCQDLIGFIKKTGRETVKQEDFEDMVITKGKFLSKLKEIGLVENVNKFVINNNIKASSGVKKLHPDPEYYATLLLPTLEKNGNKVLSREILFPSDSNGDCKKSQLTMNQIEEVLFTQGWIALKPIPLKIKGFGIKEMGQCERTMKEKGCTCTSAVNKTFHASELYRIYEAQCKQSSWGLWSKDKSGIKGTLFLDYNKIEFPISKKAGAEDMFKALLYKGIIKRPVVKFPSISKPFEEAEKRNKVIKKTLTSEKFTLALKETLHLKPEELNGLVKQIRRCLKSCVGSLHRHPRIRVNYESIETQIHLDSSQRSEELQEMLGEGIFDRIAIFDEKIRFYRNKSGLVMMLGVAEIAAGIALQISSGGTLGPLAAFLISEGSFDLVYSMKNMYNGDRLVWTDYGVDKAWSVAGSAATMPLFFLGGIEEAANPTIGVVGTTLAAAGRTAFAKNMGRRFLVEFSKAGGKTFVFTFIEGNVETGLKKTKSKLNNILGQSMDSAEIKSELEKFNKLAKELRNLGWEAMEAEQLIEKMVTTTLTGDGSTKFTLGLEMTYYKTQYGLYKHAFQKCVKGLLAPKDRSTVGASGSSGKSVDSAIALLINRTLQSLVKDMKEKVEKIKEKRKRSDLSEMHRQPLSKEEEEAFDNFLLQTNARVKDILKGRIVSHVYKKFTGHKMRTALHESIRGGYEKILNCQQILMKVVNTPDEDIEEEEIMPNLKPDSYKGELEAIVVNAGGRTVEELERWWSGPVKDLEIMKDAYGRHFVFIRDEGCLNYEFVLSTKPYAFDDFLEWKKGQVALF